MSFIQMSISGAVMIVVIILIRTLAINRLPKTTFIALWTVALAKLLVPVSIPSIFSVYSLFCNSTSLPAVEQNEIVTFAAGAISGEVQEVHNRITAAASEGTPFDPALVWIIGAVIVMAAFGAAYIVCFRNLRRAEEISAPFVDRWLDGHMIRRTVTVRSCAYISSPLTYGLLRPAIVLPENMNLDNAERLDYVLSHELTHIRRFDALRKLAVILAVCLHWFNPLVWVMFVIFNRDVELACDEAVIFKAGSGSRKAYAMALIDMEEKRSVTGTLYSCFNKNAIEERIVAIMKIKRPTFVRIAISAVIVMVVCLGFATTAYAHQDNQAELPALVSSADIDDSLSTADDVTAIPEITTEPKWVWPVASDRITRFFGPSENPLRRDSDHITIACSSGEAVVSAIDGSVTEVAFTPEHGNYIVVCGADNIRTLYGHLLDTSVTVGQAVSAGDRIGSAGATGPVTGVCLSFYVYHGDRAVDPLGFYE